MSFKNKDDLANRSGGERGEGGSVISLLEEKKRNKELASEDKETVEES